MGLLSDGTWRTTCSSTTFDDKGRTWRVDDQGDVSKPAQETCTTKLPSGFAAAPDSSREAT
ncbi:hypothetical protein GCM10010276_29410 [Streptomyces longisporus]|uniref:Uncharacterized protein n=2 Tax=Streptomyces longisporus TaxID=1948 RepID=A0ABN3LR19_STRLO